MKIGDIYKHKDTGHLIQIDSFASHIKSENPFDNIIVFANIAKVAGVYGSCPSFNGYGSQEEIEAEYDLAVSHENTINFTSWEEIINHIENK